MTTTAETPKPLKSDNSAPIGSKVFFTGSVIIHLGDGTSRVFNRGDTLEITAQILDAAKDASGSLDGSWVSRVGSTESSLAQWGEWDASQPLWQRRGDALWELELKRRLDAAWSLPGEDSQLAEVAKIRREMGWAETRDPLRYTPGQQRAAYESAVRHEDR